MTNHFEHREQFEPRVIAEEIDAVLTELDMFLLDGRFQSDEEKNVYLRKLYGLLAASNNDRVREMIRYIETEYEP